jgi:hypothetical protein
VRLTDLGIILLPRDSASGISTIQSTAASRIGPIGQKPISEVYIYKTQILNIDYTEEQAQ